MLREFLFILAICFSIGFLAFFILSEEPVQPAYLIQQPTPKPSKVVLLAVGDIMLDRGVEYMVEKYGAGDYRFPFLKIADELQEADILFGNLEGPISDRGAQVGSIYSFRFAASSADALAWAGFDVLSLANNHLFDFGRVAFEDTMRLLSKQDIEYIGAGFDKDKAYRLKIIERKGVKIGFLGYTDLGPMNWQATSQRTGMAWIDQNSLENISQYIKEIRSQVDVLVVSLHTGVEYQPLPNSFQELFAKTCIEAGADLILGHHPHTIQPVEQYQNGWIAYSLGNFVFDQGFSEQTMQGLMLKVVIENKTIKKVEHIKVQLNQFFQPLIVNS